MRRKCKHCGKIKDVKYTKDITRYGYRGKSQKVETMYFCSKECAGEYFDAKASIQPSVKCVECGRQIDGGTERWSERWSRYDAFCSLECVLLHCNCKPFHDEQSEDKA